MARGDYERVPFYSDCVDWPRQTLTALTYLVDNGVEISREWFMRNASVTQHEQLHDLIDPAYYGAAFFRLPAMPVWWFTHSCIEYVFARGYSIAQVQQMAVEERWAA